MAKPTYEVVHPKLFLRVDGKLQNIEKGTQVTLTKEAVQNLGNKVQLIGAKAQIEIDVKTGGKAE